MTTGVRATSLGGGTGRLASLRRSPILALSLAALFWSGSFVVARALRDDIDPVTMTFFRWLTSLLVFVPFVWREFAGNFHVVLREWRLITGLGVTGIALFGTLVYLALQHTTATNALLTFSLSPVAILLGASLTGGERATSRQLGGVLVSMAGAAVLITHGDIATLTSTGLNIGDVWMLAAVAVWAAYSLLLRRRPADLSQMLSLVSSIAVGLPMLLAVMLLTASGPALALSTSVVLGIGYIAIFGSVLGFLFWSYGVAELGPGRAGQFVHLMPVFGAALAFVFLGEPLSMSQILGAGLVLSGIVLIERKPAAVKTSDAGSGVLVISPGGPVMDPRPPAGIEIAASADRIIHAVGTAIGERHRN